MQMPATLSMTLSLLAEKPPVGNPYPLLVLAHFPPSVLFERYMCWMSTTRDGFHLSFTHGIVNHLEACLAICVFK